MFILYGWGTKSKLICDAGIQKCPNCKKLSTFEVREIYNNVNVFFVPIIKWSKKRYLVCPLCEAGWELEEEKVQELVDRSLKIPTNENTSKIWALMDSAAAKFLAEYEPPKKSSKNDLENFAKKLKKKMYASSVGEGFSENDIQYVLDIKFAETIQSIFSLPSK